MMDIRAAVDRAAGEDFSLETLRLDDPRDDEVVVELVATGVCHTDITGRDGRLPTPFPCVLGHEGAGRILEVGAQVTDLRPGDPVVLSFSSCGTCAHCAGGHVAYCETFPALNFSGSRPDGSPVLHDAAGEIVHGAFFGQSSFATHALAQRRNVVKVSQEVPLELLGPLGCGFQTGAGAMINVLRPARDSTVAIFGAGAVGFAALLAAWLLGCRRIVAVDRVASRLELARELGATHVVDTDRDSLAEALAEFGPIDVAIETTGVPALVEALVPALGVRGRCALVGVSANTGVSPDLRHLSGGRVLTGVREGDSNPQVFIPELVEHIRRGAFPVDRLIRFYPLSEINQAIADAKSGLAVKPVLRF